MRPLALGDPLPTLPLRLTGDLFVPVDFDAAYQEACRRRRLAMTGDRNCRDKTIMRQSKVKFNKPTDIRQ